MDESKPFEKELSFERYDLVKFC